ncbi:MAG: hypothetical protein JRI71_09535 [Deltaproteobacteria bacterium]|nr:hypothetical protein [Deltaproteobacteria bacterium]MBW2077768.1 hypothetical protein [Deltaproteobacteria bacterium]
MSERAYSKQGISESEAQEIERAYDGLLKRLKGLSGETDTEVVSEAIGDLIDFIIDRLFSKGQSLLLYTSKIFVKDYIFAHSLNVCLISIRIGLRLRFAQNRLKNLGVLALTHAQKDMGFPEGPLERMEHDKEMDEIIRLADVYDALTHPPEYRHAVVPRETLESIIDSDKLFDRRLIKILLDELTLYPTGSWVQLSNKQVGKVISVNRGQPLRPTVRVFIDWEGRYLKEKKIIDLSKDSSIHVLRPLTEEEVKHIRDS